VAFAAGGNARLRNEINVTPLVDVVLVLLIIFMVVTPMLQRGKDVTLPAAKHIEEGGKRGDPMIISVTLDKTLWFESTQVDEAGLGGEIARRLQMTPDRPLLLKGDARLTAGDVRKVLKTARAAGAKSISLGVEEIKAR
jgi:biopolymer transport protein ExbD